MVTEITPEDVSDLLGPEEEDTQSFQFRIVASYPKDAPGKVRVGMLVEGTEKPDLQLGSAIVGAVTALHMGLATMKRMEDKIMKAPPGFPLDKMLAAADVAWHKTCELVFGKEVAHA